MKHQLYYYRTADPAHPEAEASPLMQRCTLCLREFPADSVECETACGARPKCINHDFRKLWHGKMQCRTCYMDASPEFVEGYQAGYLMGRESVQYDHQFGLGGRAMSISAGQEREMRFQLQQHLRVELHVRDDGSRYARFEDESGSRSNPDNVYLEEDQLAEVLKKLRAI